MSNVSIVSELTHKIRRAKEDLFTGILAIGTNTEVEWFLYFLVGQIVWANTRTHSKRRWYRQFIRYSSNLSPQALNEVVQHTNNYKMMAQLVMQQKFSRDVFSQIVVGCISEVLFDIVHQATLTSKGSGASLVYKISARNGANFPCIGLHREPVWERVQEDWTAWQQAKLVDYCPNLAPVIVKADILQERTSEAAFRDLQKIANGQNTLRDLAIKTKQPLITLTRAFVPHIRRELIRLVDVNDLSLAQRSAPRPILSSLGNDTSGSSPTRPLVVHPTAPAEPAEPAAPTKHKAVVAYIDDNPADSQVMATIFKGSDYHYVNIPDSLQALPRLLELKPQLIFLDLVMPVVNGYELCAQIRRVSTFKDVPIIIMTNNNSLPDRVRAKVVGSTGFIGKPIRPKRVLKTVLKHLQSKPGEALDTVQLHSQLIPSA
ncbi:MAG: response regulator [Cyanobacteria bacterium P01_H01_bin.21]